MIDKESALLLAVAGLVIVLYVVLATVAGTSLGVLGFAGDAGADRPAGAGGSADIVEQGGNGTDGDADRFYRVPSSVWNDSVDYHNEASDLGFREVASDVGLDYQATQTYNSTQETNGNSGVYVADYDRDGWTDVLALGGEQPALFRNTGGAYERTNALPRVDGVVQSALWVDLENDGWRDLLLFVVDDDPIVLDNAGGEFKRQDVGFDRDFFMPQGATAADFDGDGCPGVFVYQYGHWGIEHPHGQLNYSVDLTDDNGARNWLYEGDCDSLSNVTDDAGMRGSAWTLAASAVDLTDDGDPDVHVTNDFNHDVVYVDDGEGSYERRILGDRTNRNGMSSEIADVDGDGLPDIFVTNIFFKEYIRDEIEVSLDLRAVGNNLLLNRGDGTFDERAAEFGVKRGGWGWAATLTDFDNDGDQDLLHTTRMINRNRLQEFFLTDEHRTIDRYLRYPVVRERTEDGFERLDADALGLDVSNGRGLAELDYDRDGAMDVVVADANGPLLLYENTYDGPEQPLQVALDAPANQTALGAEITVDAGGERLTQWHNAQVDFLSQDTLVRHFGTSAADSATVTVEWPDGTTQTLRDVDTGQRIVVSPDGIETATALPAS